ncbi:MAG: hypothetical protein RIB60_03050 [Phycisphaerales bacterium]
MRAALVGLMVGAAPTGASVVVYDTFGPGGSFDASQGYVVAGDDVPYALNEGQTHGVRFRAGVGGQIERIDAGLQLISGTDTVWMELWSAAGNGDVGSMLASWVIDDRMDFFGGSGTVSVEPGLGGPVLDAGERYWLISRALNDTDASWMYGEAGTGPFVWERPDGVRVYSRSTLPAVRVTVVPAPGTFTFLACALSAGTRRRR